MATPQSPDTRPTDLETPDDVDVPNKSAVAPTDTSTDADILGEQAISDSHARDDLQAKQDGEEEGFADEGTSSDIQQGATIRFPQER